MNKKRHLPWGTFINMGTVTIGSLIGMQLQQIFPESVQLIIFQAIGLGTLVLGIKMSLKIPDGYLLIFIFSLILGGVIGEMMGLKELLEGIGDAIKTSFSIENDRFSEGLITAFLLFCVGSMTIVGAIEEGLKGNKELLLIKSTLDGISSIAFASTYGVSVLFSIIPMLIFQGGITILAGNLRHFFTATIIDVLNAVGGALIIAIGINLLNLGKMNIENLLPSLVVVVILTWFKQRWTVKETLGL